MPTPCFMVGGPAEAWESSSSPEGERRRVGAMFWWRHRYRAEDEREAERRPMPHLAVMTPAGIACLDCPESGPPHGHWSRTGTPPNVTVSPSLNISEGTPNHWHGFVRNGRIEP